MTFIIKEGLQKLNKDELIFIKDGTDELNKYYDSEFDWNPVNSYIFVYEDNSLVGFGIFCLDTSVDKLWLSKLFIKDNERKKGYGKFIINNLLENFKKTIRAGVDINNQNSIDFFTKISNPVTKIFEIDYVVQELRM